MKYTITGCVGNSPHILTFLASLSARLVNPHTRKTFQTVLLCSKELKNKFAEKRYFIYMNNEYS